MSKLYEKQLALFDRQRRYPLDEAFEILKSMPATKFDQTVEVAFKLGIDAKKSDQSVRGAVPLPKGTGKSVRIAVVASGSQADEAKAAGAEFVGSEDLVDKLKSGWIDFDVLIATPDAMKMVRPLGKVLGPRGLMPNPKTGTVTDAVGNAVREAKAGRVEFRTDRGGCIHAPIGKLSFASADLRVNFDAVYFALSKAKPTNAKGTYFVSCTVSATMSPGIRIDVTQLARQVS
ncbi:MAG: 50S ribosomal protein L1 [Victivallaceae bacterium]|jgi:large subunit ribosomal protein L1|nr:50S ribosomal protein L1 [Victivallaceae bacterium]MDD3703091.1 50S ribosomal protein L1 [Victivallaceae bacterium]MDD4316997.1 50S ribosomal protein L1 [Victivallaceae bacterium]MDD5663416.1 50S ribosomal protein L1 [Victivallaceae bacterium]NLK83893.1 50S ribosomal protein L1 [Lentisphaerota bacterium]